MAIVIGNDNTEVLYSTSKTEKNLLMNGDFESIGNDSANQWGLYQDHLVAGWYTPGRMSIELQQGQFYGTPENSVTNTVLELDSNGNTWVQQDVDVSTLTQSNEASLHLSFDYANRYKGNNHSTSQFEVKVFDQSGNILYSKYFDNTQENDHYVNFTVDFVVPEGIDGITLRLEGKGQSDGYGALIDNLSLTANFAEDINDVIDGLDGNDSIHGGVGDDLLVGGNGNDKLEGGDGDDIIYGNVGRNLLVNGDFEQWGDDSGSRWGLFDDHQVSGWYTPGTNKIELQQGKHMGAPENSIDNTVLELDSHTNTWVQQEVKVSEMTQDKEATFTLNFDFANRYRASNTETSQFEVKVFDQNGRVIYKKYFDNDQSNENYVHFSENINVAQGIDYVTLRFEAEGLSDTYGALIDNVSLVQASNLESDNDIINGGNGNDTIYGQQGDDVISGGYGDDILHGGEGNDVINGGEGDDILYGGKGNDHLKGAGGDDSLYGGKGNDILEAGYEDDIVMDGGEGLDRYLGSEGNDTMYFDQEDFSDIDFLNDNPFIYLGDRGFDKLIANGDAQIDFSGKSYGLESGPHSISQIEAVVGDEAEQHVTVKATTILHHSDPFQTITNDSELGDWNGFVSYLGEGEDTFNFEAIGWVYEQNATPNASLSPEIITFLGLNTDQVDQLQSYEFVRGNDSVTVWTDAEQVLQDGHSLFG